MKKVHLLGSYKINCIPDEDETMLRADTSELKEYMNPRALRRVDAFTRMALLSVKKALEQSSLTLTPQRTGLILGSVNGPVNATLRFLDNLIDDGDEFASPTWFSTSIHNAMAAQLALNLDIQGPTRTITADSETLALSLQNAVHWLNTGVCDVMIVCIGDEVSELLYTEKEQHDGCVCYILGKTEEGLPFSEGEKSPVEFSPFTHPTEEAEKILSNL